MSDARREEQQSTSEDQVDAEVSAEEGQLAEQVEAEEESESFLERLSHVEVSRVSIAHTLEAQLTSRDTLSLEGQLEVMSSKSKGRVRSAFKFFCISVKVSSCITCELYTSTVTVYCYVMTDDELHPYVPNV